MSKRSIEYQEERLRRAKIRKEKRKNRKPRKGTCSRCWNSGASYRANPFQADMNNKIIMEWLCGSCYSDIAGDI